jgi:hypothetical protein
MNKGEITMKFNYRIKTLLGVVSILILLSAVGCSKSDTTTKSINNSTTSNSGSEKNLSSNDASANNKSPESKALQGDPDIKGYVTELNGDSLKISKVNKNSNGALVGSKKGSKTQANTTEQVAINNTINIIIRNSSNMGKTFTDKKGSISDIKVNSMVNIWGKKQGDNFVATDIVVFNFN